jgi:endo-1,4-beta-xylanase
MKLGRRAMLAAAAGVCQFRSSDASELSLNAIAAQRGLIFGSEVISKELQSPDYAALYFSQCGAMTPGLEAKWAVVEPEPGVFDFQPLDHLVDLATTHHMKLRLHTLVWSLAMPNWASAAIANGSAASILDRHIRTVVGRYRGRAYCWDVANEVTDPRWHPGADGLTHQPWYKALGPSFIPLSFHAAREADPDAKLFLNDSDLEGITPDRAEKRATYLRLIAGWKRAGIPIDGFGLQAHLRPEITIDEPGYRHFLHELADMGLEIHITEMDFVDQTLPADTTIRDRAAADLCRRYLDITLDEPAVRMVVTWGLSDRESWLNSDPGFRRPDRLRVRGMPYDEALAAKPMRAAIATALANARSR